MARISIEPHGAGWQWSVADAHCNVDWYKTNEEGEGLWKWDGRTRWAQILGCDQFKMPATKEGALRKITRHVEQQIPWRGKRAKF